MSRPPKISGWIVTLAVGCGTPNSPPSGDATVTPSRDSGTDAPDSRQDAGVDASTDVGVDASTDVGVDASTDAGVDASTDASTPSATVLQVSAGYAHVCAVLSTGVVKCWGQNNAKQLGDGTDLIRGRATPVVGLGGAAAQVSAGDGQSCAVLRSGELWCWGLNMAPRHITGLGLASSVSVQGSDVCARLRDGTVWCWGSAAAPLASVPGLVGATAISGRCAIVAGGAVQCSVVDYESGTVSLKTVQGIAGATGLARSVSGEWEGCAVTPQGVACWQPGATPTATLLPGTNGAVDVAMVEYPFFEGLGFENRAACITMAGGDVHCGIPGRPLSQVQSLPPAQATTRGASFACALARDGKGVHCWGLTHRGQLGDGTYQATSLVATGLSNVTALATSEFHGCLVNNGAAQCWGSDDVGQLGRGMVTGYGSLGPVPTLTAGVAKVVTGEKHSCALLTGGDVYCWGSNDIGGNGRGQLGNGTYVSSATPVLSFTGAVDIAATSATSCALRANGEVWCWGSDRYFQLLQLTPLPDGDWSHTAVRTQVTGAQKIAGGGAGTMCALSTGGGADCWGHIGDYFQPGGSAPVSDVASLAAGENHACARMMNGTVNCWGENSYGSSPGLVAGITSATQVAAGAGGVGGHSCALLAGGDVRCWGDNAFGQLGDGTTVNRRDPRVVLGVSNATILAAGRGRTCAALGNGELRCWGGPFVSFTNVPVRVLDLP